MKYNGRREKDYVKMQLVQGTRACNTGVEIRDHIFSGEKKGVGDALV